jgi:UDP-GlcNAc:undecaprenyl-phosphate/decaprenyl-phosphate GlcNAc-1-phosphate transferase
VSGTLELGPAGIAAAALAPGALGPALYGAIIGLGASLLFTPMVGRLALFSGAVDHPGPRKVHDRPLPRLGGVAINLAFWMAIWLSATPGVAVPSALVGFAIGSALIVAVGVYDDHRDASASLRFLVQGIAAEIAVQSGFRLTLGRWLLHGLVPPGAVDAFEHALTIFWIMGVTNALNFLDGLNFLCAGVSLVCAASLAAVAYGSGHAEFLPLYLTLVAVLAGFGVYNRTPASIFLGDSGATFLGYFLACFAAWQGSRGDQVQGGAPVLPLILLAVPVADTLYAIGRRLYLKVSPFSGDRGHLHHRLLAMGYDQNAAVRALCGASAWLGLAAVGFSLARGYMVAGLILVVVMAGLAVAAQKLSLFDPAVMRSGRNETSQR